MKVILTGATGGFGILTSKTLKAAGHEVVGTTRSKTGRAKPAVDELEALGIHLIEMDVTDEASVNAGVSSAIDHLGGLDVVINNAGIGTMGMIEHFTPEDLARVFDVNVLGVQRVNRAVLPFLRKQGSGTILYISSLLGRVTLPFYGAYQTSKWALEALAENYRTELSGFGIESVLIEPGGYPTAFIDNLVKPSDQSRDGEYGDFMYAPQGMLEGFEKVLESNTEQRPQKVADAILEVLTIPRGEKPMRKTVDFLGMGEHIDKYNEVLAGVTHGIYSNFGTEGMLRVDS